MSGPLPVVVLVSGRGSNLRAIDARIAAGELPARIVAVLSDREDAAALAWAAERGLATGAVPQHQYADRAAFDAALGNVIAGYAPALIVLAGFMRILGSRLVERFAGRMLNIHPSLLPAHRGLHTHRRVLEAGERTHGCTVHFVVEELDAGPAVIQGRLPVRPGEDEGALSARVQRLEHIIYPRAVGWFAAGRLAWRDGAAWLDDRVLRQPVIEEDT